MLRVLRSVALTHFTKACQFGKNTDKEPRVVRIVYLMHLMREQPMR